MINEYEKQALDFLEKTNTTFKVEYLRNDLYFPGDKDKRDIYKITLSRGSRSCSFEFGQSISNSGKYERSWLNGLSKRTIKKAIKPNSYDVLTCIQKSDIGSFENFCSEFGYDTDSKKAEKTYLAVCDEYKNLCTLYSDAELELMAEIL